MIQFSISFKQYNVLLWIYISYASSELVTQKLLHFENESRVKMEKFQILNFLFNGNRIQTPFNHKNTSKKMTIGIVPKST